MRGYDIVLGKLAAAALPALFNLLAIFPILAIPLTLGGVTGTQLWQVPLVLMTTQFLSLSLGLAVSVWFYNGRKAAGVTLLLLLLIIIGPVVVGGLYVGRTGSNLPMDIWALKSDPGPGIRHRPQFLRLACPGLDPGSISLRALALGFAGSGPRGAGLDQLRTPESGRTDRLAPNQAVGAPGSTGGGRAPPELARPFVGGCSTPIRSTGWRRATG